MNKTQVVLSIFGVLIIILLYNLPRIVVNNESSENFDSHGFTISSDDAEAIQSLKSALKSGNSENSFNFADSLAGYFLKYGYLDSAEALIIRHMTKERSLLMLKKTAALQYAIYERSVGSKQTIDRANAARSTLTEILNEEPDNLTIKTMLAMTLVNTENPMAAIQLLREVLVSDPDNREATLNLGLLAIQSGQYDRAIERFAFLMTKDSLDYEVQLYLGVALMESGNKAEATKTFNKVANALDADPALKAAALEYLK